MLGFMLMVMDNHPSSWGYINKMIIYSLAETPTVDVAFHSLAANGLRHQCTSARHTQCSILEEKRSLRVKTLA